MNPIKLSRRGRPGNISSVSGWLEDPIEPLCFARLNDRHWFKRLSAFALTHLRDGRYQQQLPILPAMQQHIRLRIEQLHATPMSKFFEESTERYPNVRLTRTGRLRAIALSRTLLNLTRFNPYLVRRAVMSYCFGASSRFRVFLVDDCEAQYGAAILELIEELKIPWLKVRFVGFRIGDQEPDMTPWEELLEFAKPAPGQPGTPFDIVNARSGSHYETGHLGIDIQRSGRNSREFHKMMILAAITEIWNCVTPVIPDDVPLLESSVLEPHADRGAVMPATV